MNQLQNQNQKPILITLRLSDFLQILLRHREWACPSDEVLQRIKLADPSDTLCHIEEEPNCAPKVWYIHEWRISYEHREKLKAQQKADNIKSAIWKDKHKKLTAVLSEQCGGNAVVLEQLIKTAIENPIAFQLLYGINLTEIDKEYES